MHDGCWSKLNQLGAFGDASKVESGSSPKKKEATTC